MSEYKGLFTFDIDNHKYIPIVQADGIVTNYDYDPEPLIKDMKIRKAVRAWANAIGAEDNIVVTKNMEYHGCCIYWGALGNQAFIDFNVDLDITENSYTIAELCGE